MYTYNTYVNVCVGVGVCMLRKSIMYTYLNTVDTMSNPQPEITCITPLSFVCCNFIAECPLQMYQIILSSFSVLWNVPTADAGCFPWSSGPSGFWSSEAGGSLSVWVISLHPRAQAICTTLDLAISVSKSCFPYHELRKSANGVKWLDNVDKDTSG